MTIVSFKKIQGSDRSAHQLVEINDDDAGEVWREQASVVVSKLTQPRRMATKWRWFAKVKGQARILGRGDRVAMILGPGFSTKDQATDALVAARGTASN